MVTTKEGIVTLRVAGLDKSETTDAPYGANKKERMSAIPWIRAALRDLKGKRLSGRSSHWTANIFDQILSRFDNSFIIFCSDFLKILDIFDQDLIRYI